MPIEGSVADQNLASHIVSGPQPPSSTLKADFLRPPKGNLVQISGLLNAVYVLPASQIASMALVKTAHECSDLMRPLMFGSDHTLLVAHASRSVGGKCLLQQACPHVDLNLQVCLHSCKQRTRSGWDPHAAQRKIEITPVLDPFDKQRALCCLLFIITLARAPCMMTIIAVHFLSQESRRHALYLMFATHSQGGGMLLHLSSFSQA